VKKPKPKPTSESDLTRKERIYARRVPGQALTKEQWEALGFDVDGGRTRPLTQDPIGAHPHPQPSVEGPS
jgi:hypothetical protein